jgi:cobalt-zinc-cadmium efflux system protein
METEQHATAAGLRTATGRHRGRLRLAAGIILAILAIEIAGGIVTGSLALLADAGHMATDAAGIGLSLLAAHFAAKPATNERTFGYARAEILAATLNALLLFGVAAFILAESIRRLVSAPAVTPGPMIVFGVIALAGTGTAALLLGHGQAESLNVRGAFLEVVSDALGAAAVIAAGIIIVATGFTRADPIASLAIGTLILPRTWRLLRDAIDVLLEATPKGVDLDEVRRHLTALEGVADVHDLHAWTITSGIPVLSAHIVVEPAVISNGHSAHMLDLLQECLRGHFDVEHSTFQLEPGGHADHEPSACI